MCETSKGSLYQRRKLQKDKRLWTVGRETRE
jgi:hypothetical protein